ncbi:MAG: RluA family pseudouridine synthase [Candidatus Neomarinimicrobiota bacterium]
MNLETTKIIEPATSAAVGKRLDIFLTEYIPELSRTKIGTMIKNGKVLVNQQASKTGYRLREKDAVRVLIEPDPPSQIQPEYLPLEILYEDKYLFAVNKMPGVVVHPGAGIRQGTLVSGLLNYTNELSSVGGIERPGLVHRLDKDTSGVIVVAKNNEAHWKMSRLFAERQVYKQYRTFVYGVPEPAEGLIDAPIQRCQHNRQTFTVHNSGRPARTRYAVLKDFRIMAYLSVVLETGRTHQVRVHLQYINHPVVGDPVYGGAARKGPSVNARDVGVLKNVQALARRQLLHAFLLRFNHPFTGEDIEICAPLPADFTAVLNVLEAGIGQQ